MTKSEINGTGNDHLSDGELRQLKDALNTLARMITRSILREKSRFERSDSEEYHDSAIRAYRATTTGERDEPLTLSVQEAARILGLSRGSAYEAIHTGRIPSIRFGKRIVVPRAALDRVLSQADNYEPDHR